MYRIKIFNIVVGISKENTLNCRQIYLKEMSTEVRNVKALNALGIATIRIILGLKKII